MTDTALTPAAEAAIRDRLVLGYRFDTSRYPPFAALWTPPTPFDDIATLLSELDSLRTALAEIRETAKLWHGELLGCRTALAAACAERDAALARVHDVTEAARAIVQRWNRLGGMIGPDVERLWDALAALDRQVGDPVPGAPGGGE